MSGSRGWVRTSDNPVNSRTLCQLSYAGSQPPIVGRILAHVEAAPTGCALWTGAIANNGYGQIGVDGRTRSAHVVAFEAAHGPVEPGMQVGHVCHDRDATCPGGNTCLHRRCVNPDHLAAMTHVENQLASRHTMAGRQVCKQGHALSGDNLYRHPRGTRVCIACRREHSRQYRARVGSAPP